MEGASNDLQNEFEAAFADLVTARQLAAAALGRSQALLDHYPHGFLVALEKEPSDEEQPTP